MQSLGREKTDGKKSQKINKLQFTLCMVEDKNENQINKV